ncbi:DNA alkylation repair protein [Chitinophaga sp. GCM10012297]|uniref:DNA alkylation repair protein n=1 Tax=Chitinophaga chungangae TaxID=2821488 RepID=A0ABS3YBS1_9BACT|nr:DNA alkylation repair protein [Chitinophaga chungangae]MBO9152133.1 DNA alkylation repair protein [Chitinophaga chungangae]
MEPLKEMFNREFYRHFAQAFAGADKNFNPKTFIKDVTQGMETLSLNGRLRNTSVMLHKHLPGDFTKAAEVLFKAAPSLQTGYTALVLPDFVALYGKQHFDLSMEALKRFTTIGSSEFAIREFLKTDLDKTLKVMNKWAEDKNHHVRRLASEGSRPRLPWSFKLDGIIKKPALTQTILEKLNADEELYVRKSVANHLNDHSKDNTAYMLQLVKNWDKRHRHTAWIIKHAIRTLIKKGDKEALDIFGFGEEAQVKFGRFWLDKTSLRLGDTLQFSFQLASKKETPQKLVIDYAVHYIKSSGETSKKVFKLKETELQPGQTLQIVKKQLFQDLTTRKHYPGKHLLEIIVNGKTMGSKGFSLSV